jgi:8-oxo-dGTP pyrophosphatase MutT (NUDIX family)
MDQHWKPSVTVAAIIERDGQFLLVEEQTSDGLRLNQPAGHLEQQESLLQAVVRETLEETAFDFTPTALIGMYMTRFTGHQGGDRTYLRFAFSGDLGQQQARALDTGIVRTLWMSYAELAACPERHRTPMLMQCLDDYLRGQRLPLEVLFTHHSVGHSNPPPATNGDTGND